MSAAQGARCSTLSEAAGEQLIGSAPRAAGWVALEQNGPWGARAFTASHLDRELGAALETAATMAGVRPTLVRRPGRHADEHRAVRHRLLVAHSLPGRTWLLSADVADPAEVLALDWRAVAEGDLAASRASLPSLRPVEEPHLLVCTNGTRDVCCAVAGRPVAAAAALSHPGQVWEATHTSGHRFAPTAVLLPHGTLHGRLDGTTAGDLLDAAARSETVLAGTRGRSAWPPAGQVADHAVRLETGELDLDALTVSPAGDGWLVRHRDGRSWRVAVGSEPVPGTERPESCGKAALPMVRWTVESVTALRGDLR
jgi:hypothetical protein